MKTDLKAKIKAPGKVRIAESAHPVIQNGSRFSADRFVFFEGASAMAVSKRALKSASV